MTESTDAVRDRCIDGVIQPYGRIVCSTVRPRCPRDRERSIRREDAVPSPEGIRRRMLLFLFVGILNFLKNGTQILG